MADLLLYHHWDKDNIIDDFVLYALDAFHRFGFEIIFSTNSPLDGTQKKRIPDYVVKTYFRDNSGFDFGAWKEVLLAEKERVLAADRLLLLNNSCFGPLFPLTESFDRMEKAGADYWGISSCEGLPDAPDHLHSYFVCFTSRVVRSEAFWKFWEKVYCYADFWDAVFEGERRLSLELAEAGFRYRTVADVKDRRPAFSIGFKEAFSLYAADYLILKYRLPFLKIKAFKHDSYLPFQTGGKIMRALDSAGSPYPKELITRYLNRAMPLSAQKNLPERLKIFPKTAPGAARPHALKLAVISHVFYADLLDEILPYLKHIAIPFDLLITTTAERDRESILRRLAEAGYAERATVRVVENHGRDVLPWLTAFRDVHDRYDLCLKVHAKKSGYQAEAFGFMWHRFLMESLLASPDYVEQILNAFESDGELGMMFSVYPPLVKLMSPAACYEDVDFRDRWLELLGVTPKGREDLSVFSVGTMFWYRPKALRKLFQAEISPALFQKEPLPVAHTMAHGLERALPYIVQAEGFTFSYVIPPELLAESFHIYEDRISSLMNVSSCGFELFTAREPKCFAQKRSLQKVVETDSSEFSFWIDELKVRPEERYWRLDFGNPGELIHIQDLRLLDRKRECVVSLRKDFKCFEPVGCTLTREEDFFRYVPLSKDPQLHFVIPEDVDPAVICAIALVMHYENNYPVILDCLKSKEQAIRQERELKERGKLIEHQQAYITQREELIAGRDAELAERGQLIAHQQSYIAQQEESIRNLTATLEGIYASRSYRVAKALKKFAGIFRIRISPRSSKSGGE